MERNEFWRIVKAVGLLEVFDALTQRSFGVVSPFYSGLSYEEKRRRMDKMKFRLREHNYGFVAVSGVWTESKEGSLLIPHISKDETKKLAEEYEQDFFTYAERGSFKIYQTKWGDILNEGRVKDKFSPNAPALGSQVNCYGEGIKGEGITDPLGSAGDHSIIKSGSVKEDFKVLRKEDKGKDGFWFKGGKFGFTLETKFDLNRAGQGFFFVVENTIKYVSPRYGIAVHNFGDTDKLFYSENSFMSADSLAVYLQLQSAPSKEGTK